MTSCEGMEERKEPWTGKTDEAVHIVEEDSKFCVSDTLTLRCLTDV